MKILPLLLLFSQLVTLWTPCFGQKDLPLNFNDSYMQPQTDFRAIKTLRTYSKGDYESLQTHLFNLKGLNYRTFSHYKGELQSFTQLSYDSLDRLINIEEHGRWIGNDRNRIWDSTKVSWTNKYLYDSQGRISKCTNLWFDDNQEGISFVEMSYQYNDLNKVIVETETWKDLDSSSIRIRFEPNSDIISENQNFPTVSINKRIFEYGNQEDLIKSYSDNELKTVQKIQRISDRLHIEYLLNTEGDTLRFTKILFDQNGRKISEIDSGDSDISLFGTYGDGGSWSTRTFTYNQYGLLERKIFSSGGEGLSLFIDYQYLKK
ncbi:MAG: hypothetical protein RIC30_10830 [Marinoscillum sp.]|uniref:hypothetical protein n=1 Tax=Marinoscillum sp. TaxID=2024838 RepID=UPI0033023A30